MSDMRRRLVPLALAPAVLLAAALPAMAASTLPPPPYFPDDPDVAFYYNMWFGPEDPNWAPRGTVVADSGFRSNPNGLPYANYGSTAFPLFFGTPDTLITGLSSPWVRSLYGDAVCADKPKADGSCTLTPAAEYFADYLAGQAEAIGHCVGIAVTTQAIYAGLLEPSTVDAGSLPIQSRLTPDTQSMILRNWATQATTPTTQLTPAQVVQQLIAELKPGAMPNSLIIQWPTGGHGITPYAVYDRGNGLYDIAVYDNNYPSRARAIHVDTVANTWEYEVAINPSAPPEIVGGDAKTLSMQLMNVEAAIAEQECPVCLGGRDTNLLVADPVPTAAAANLNLALLDLQGSTLGADRATPLPTLDSSNPDFTSLPGFDIDPGEGFQAIWTTGAGPAVPLTVADASANGVKVVSVAALPADDTLAIVYDDKQGIFSAQAASPIAADLTHVFSVGKRHITVQWSGGKAVPSTTARAIALDRGRGIVGLGDTKLAGGQGNVTAELQVGSTSQTYRASRVSYPAGSELVLVYKSWTNSRQAPKLWLDRGGDGKLDKRIPMKKVR